MKTARMTSTEAAPTCARARLWASGAALGLVVGVAWPSSADACGGFFCAQQQPVLQTAERIVFVERGDGRYTAVVQIQYTGPSERFSWVVPVPGIPEVGVSSNIVFQRLQRLSEPQFQLTRVVEGTCKQVLSMGGSVDAGSSVVDGGVGPGSGVQVLASGSVGPYDYELISLDPELPSPADAAVQWLGANGYDVTAIGPGLLGPYLDDGMNLLAFRLQKDRSAGDIRPVTMTYETVRPMIPIKLTAVAAQPNMGVLAWVVGPARAVPSNYLSLELNEARIDWLRGGANYNALVSAAADEAGGQGFVTEYASADGSAAAAVFGISDERAWRALESQDYAGREEALLVNAALNFGTWDGVAEVMARHVTLPEGVSMQDFLLCLPCNLPGDGSGPIEGFDVTAFQRDFYESVVQPVADTQTLLELQPYVTRLYTTLSAEEMTIDPMFTYNPELPEVLSQHAATQYIQCTSDVTQAEAPWRVELEDGSIVRGEGQQWPSEVSDLPANRRVLRLSESGIGELVADNGAAIDRGLEELARNDPTEGIVGDGRTSSCNCRQSESPAGAALLGWALIAGLICRRRRN